MWGTLNEKLHFDFRKLFCLQFLFCFENIYDDDLTQKYFNFWGFLKEDIFLTLFHFCDDFFVAENEPLVCRHCTDLTPYSPIAELRAQNRLLAVIVSVSQVKIQRCLKNALKTIDKWEDN